MATTTKLPHEKLSEWYYAVTWGKYHVQQAIERSEQYGFDPSYERHQLERLEDLEQFLKMNWDNWMDSLLHDQTAEEITHGI